MSGEHQGAKLKVFISYSRWDEAFAEELKLGLEDKGYIIDIDKHSIRQGEEWKARLGKLIADCDTVVFVLSPDSARSQICHWEVDEAHRLAKRIVPVLYRGLAEPTRGKQADGPPWPDGPVKAPERLTLINYPRFDEGRSFMAGLRGLVQALEDDLAWIEAHSRLAARARDWDEGGRPSNRLMSGADIAQAKRLVETRKTSAPPMLPVQMDYIHASEVHEAAQSSAQQREADEKRRLAEEALTQSRKAERRTRTGLIAAILLAAIASLFGLYAFKQKGEADAQRRLAEHQSATAAKAAEAALAAEKAATETRNTALLNQSKYLTNLSAEETAKGEPVTGLLLALEALPDETSDDQLARSRPYWAPAEVQLEVARRLLREKGVLSGHESGVRSVKMSTDGTRIITGSDDTTARIWDARTLTELGQLNGHTRAVSSVAISPDGSRIITGSAQNVLVGSQDNNARIWDAATFAELGQLKGHMSPIRSVAITPDGARFITGSVDWTARVWDAASFTELGKLAGHTASVFAVAVSQDGSRIITGSEDRTARVWDASTFVELGQLIGHRGTVRSVAVSPDGARIITCSDETVARVWDASTFTELGKLEGHTALPRSVAVSPDGARIITGSSDGTVTVWDTKAFKKRAEFKGHRGAVTSVAVSPNGESILTGSDDGTARVWDARTTPELAQITVPHAVRSVAMNPDGTRIIAGSSDGTTRVLNAKSFVELAVLNGHTRSVASVAVSPNGAQIVTGSSDGTARVWDAKSFAELAILKGHTRSVVRGVVVATDGKIIVTGSDDWAVPTGDNAARVWDAGTFAELGQLNGHTRGVSSVAISSDGAHIVTGSIDGIVRVWDAKSFAELALLKGHKSGAMSVAVSPDSKLIITGSSDGTVRLWDAKSFAELTVITLHEPGRSIKVAVTTDNLRIVTAAIRGTVKVWDAKSLSKVAELTAHNDFVNSIALSPDGRSIVTGSDDRSVRVWELFSSGVELINHAKWVTPRCLTENQRQRYHLPSGSPRWCTTEQKWPYDAATVLNEALRAAGGHMENKHYIEAIAVIEKVATGLSNLIERVPATSSKVTSVLASAHEFIAGIAVIATKEHFEARRYAEAIADLEHVMTGLQSVIARVPATNKKLSPVLNMVKELIADITKIASDEQLMKNAGKPKP